MSQFTVPPNTVGVYEFVHLLSGSAYIGSSRRDVRNRVLWHLTKLRAEAHPSPRFQELWNESEEQARRQHAEGRFP